MHNYFSWVFLVGFCYADSADRLGCIDVLANPVIIIGACDMHSVPCVHVDVHLYTLCALISSWPHEDQFWCLTHSYSPINQYYCVQSP